MWIWIEPRAYYNCNSPHVYKVIHKVLAGIQTPRVLMEIQFHRPRQPWNYTHHIKTIRTISETFTDSIPASQVHRA